jgi:imidazolonepropionase-like amidohydrolase
MLFDQAIREVRQPETAREGALLLPEGRAALKTFLAGGRVVFRVQRASDIRQVIGYAKRHGMKPVIAGGSEAWLVAAELAAADVPVILDALENLPQDFDRLGARLDNAALLHAAGVRIAFSNNDSHQARKNRQLAGNAAAHGLPRDAALAAITAQAADIFGLGATRGRIAVGQVADLVLWSGDPLEVTSAADQVWIAGRPMEMRSRQTELRDRYLERLRSSGAN